jgi:hypothetical protein
VGERISVGCNSMFWLAFLITGVGVLLFGPLVSLALTISRLFRSRKMTPRPPSCIQSRWSPSSVCGGDDFYQLQQAAMVCRPELGGWCLAFWLLVSLALTTSELFSFVK